MCVTGELSPTFFYKKIWSKLPWGGATRRDFFEKNFSGEISQKNISRGKKGRGIHF
jgi:hypothetical protein